MSVEIVVPWSGMEEVRDRWPKLMDDYSRAIGNRLRKLLPGLINSMLGRYKTGKLAASAKAYIGLKEISIVVGEGVTDTEGYAYAPVVLEKGAPPHVMSQAGKTWPMRWKHAGGSGVAWKVNHPGQPPRHDIMWAILSLAYQVAAEELMIFQLLGAS